MEERADETSIPGFGRGGRLFILDSVRVARFVLVVLRSNARFIVAETSTFTLRVHISVAKCLCSIRYALVGTNIVKHNIEHHDGVCARNPEPCEKKPQRMHRGPEAMQKVVPLCCSVALRVQGPK